MRQIEEIPAAVGKLTSSVPSWPRRYTVVVLFALATALCYVDRVNISIAIIPLALDKGYDAAARVSRSSAKSAPPAISSIS